MTAADKQKERAARAKKMLAYLKKAYPDPKTELSYKTPIQLVAAVMLSAQSTDKHVNMVTETLWKKYKAVDDFADADLATFTKEISSITFYRNKAKAIIAMAKMVRDEFKGKIPKTETELVRLPGVAYKSAHVIAGELYGIYEGIPTDTHVRRFALRFDLTDSKDLTKISKDLEALIQKSDWKYVNNGLVLYGRYVCKALPHPCEDHPLTKIWPPAAHRWPKAK
ncbi:MAG TPA: endonuclease III [Candidatus Paceibacterota bacterium]|jgi:endonuclease-3|nr:endonuclease III [Candidatus Paceibacterota bacterium]